MPFEYRSDMIMRHLAALQRRAPGVRGVAVTTSDGLVIAAYPPAWEADIHDPTSGENVAALAAVIAGMAERSMARLEQGQLERVLMEGEKGVIAVFPITIDSALAILVEKGAKLGLVLNLSAATARELHAVLKKKE